MTHFSRCLYLYSGQWRFIFPLYKSHALPPRDHKSHKLHLNSHSPALPSETSNPIYVQEPSSSSQDMSAINDTMHSLFSRAQHHHHLSPITIYAIVFLSFILFVGIVGFLVLRICRARRRAAGRVVVGESGGKCMDGR